MQDIGTLTLTSPDGTPGRTLQLTNLVWAVYKDHRFCTVARAEDNTIRKERVNKISGWISGLKVGLLMEAGQAYTVRCAGLTATTTVRSK